MRGLNHPFIIEYRGYFTDDDFGGHQPTPRHEALEDLEETYRGSASRERLQKEQQQKK